MKRFHSGRSEAGETLIEVIMSTALMGIIVVAVVGGLATVILGSVVHRDQATGNSVLVSAMENVKSADVDRVPCDPGTTPVPIPPSYAQAVQDAKPPAWNDPTRPGTVKIDSITYEKFDTATNEFTVDDPGCNETATNCDQGVSATCNGLTMQLVTVSATPPGGRDTRTLSFVKGDN